MTEEQLLELRELLQEPESEEWSDDRLNRAFASQGTVRAAAKLLWESKMRAAAALVDVSENGSSRKLGDLYKNYAAIAKSLEDDTAVIVTGTRPTMNYIVRA